MLLDTQGAMNAIKNTMNELKKLSDEEKINLPKDVYLRNIFCRDCSLKKTCGETPCENYEYWKEGYEKGLAALEKENAKLKAQIEKMKCCGNCRHWENESIQKYCVLTAPDFLIKKRIDKCDKWESAKS